MGTTSKNISGLSTISRTPKNKFNDNTSEEFKFINTDKLAIDGNRLVITEGTEGQSNAVYGTEIGNTIRIYPKEVSSEGYDWFEVFGKDGSKVEYGNTNDSRVQTDRGVISWLINKITDLNGNYIEFEYSDYEGQKFIKTISYTGNSDANLTPYARIEFKYNAKPDKNVSYLGGIAMKESLVLSQVKVKYGDVVVRKYEMNYIQNEYTQLYSVTELGKNNEEINSTLFNYDYEVPTELNFLCKNVNTHNIQGLTGDINYYFGDLNRDGITDRVIVERTSNNMANWYLQFGVYYDCQSEDCGNISFVNPSGGAYQFQTVDYNPTGHRLLRENVIVADINNDGKDDLIIPYLDGYSSCWNGSTDLNTPFENLKVKIYTSDGSKFNFITEYTLNSDRLVGDDGDAEHVNINELFIPGDFNGDGYLELIVKTQQLDYYGIWPYWCVEITRQTAGTYDYANAWYISLTDGSGNINTSVTWQPIITGHGDEKLQIIPVQAVKDNKTELLVICNDDYEGIYHNGNSSSGNCYCEKVPGIDSQKTYNFASGDMKYHVGDFNGDGYSDILFRDENDDDKWKIKYWKGSDFSTDFVLDFMDDLEYDRGIYSYQFSWEDLSTALSDRSKGVFYDLLLADFNGDGKTDILTYERKDKFRCEAGSYWYCPSPTVWRREWHDNIYHSYNESGQQTHTYTYLDTTDLKIQLLLIKGVSDTNVIYNKYEKSVYNINRSDDNKYLLVEDIVRHDKWPLIQTMPFGSDLNGDNNADMFNFRNNGIILSVYSNEVKRNLQSISDGFGNKTELKYQVISKPSGVYSSNRYSFLPLRDILSNIYVVSEVDKYLYKDSNPFQQVGYSYYDAIAHKDKGFLGFKGFIQKNSYLDGSYQYAANETYNELDNVKYVLNPHYIYNTYNYYISDDEDPNFGWNAENLSFIELTNARKDLASNRYFYYQSKTESYDYLNNIAQFKIDTLDDWQNITSSMVFFSSESNPRAKVYSVTKYTNEGTWCDSKPDTTIVYHTHKDDNNNNDVYSRMTTYEYYDQSGKYSLKKVNYDPDRPKAVTTEFEYNDFGNITHITKSQSDEPNLSDRESTYEWDSKGRFNTKETNSLNYVVLKNYDEVFGKVFELTDVGGLKTKFKYDNFGREIKNTSPLGLSINTDYSWCISLSSPRTMYKVSTTQDNSPTSTAYYNSMGRELRTEKNSFNGKTIVADKEYFKDGRLYRETYPYFLGSSRSLRYITYSYDDYLRPTEVNKIGLETTYSYNGKETTITDPNGKVTKKSVDDLGNTYQTIERITSSEENQVNFKFNCNGKVDTIKTIKQNVQDEYKVVSTYDDYGNQTILADPDAGSYLYDYNPFGEMKSQTDPLGNKEIIYYDQLGRVFKREFKDPSDFLKYRITYDFVSPGTTDASSLHLLTFTDASDNVINKIQYTYDNFGRISSKDEYVGNDQFTWTYTYNQYSRVSTETYPSGVAATYLYDDKGFLNQVKRTDGSHNEVIWQLDSLDEFEKTIQSRVGEGNITTKYEFNDYELPTRIHTFKGETFQDLQYSFDPNRGVLTWRRDEKNNQEESFGYDELYRLTRDTINNDLNKIITLSYYKDGSINNKSDVGTYYYSDGQTQNPPHGVKKIPEIEGNTSISHLKQDITHNMFNRVEELRIKNGNDIVEEAIFTYGHDKNRRKMEFRETGELLYTKFYLGNYEKIVRADNSIKEITYISGRSGIVAAIVKGDDELNPTAEQTIFIHTDHLGSIQALSREKEGQPGEYEVITEFAYDPWGRLRNETNWLTYYNDEGAFSHFALLERGFIGQEHLSKFGLINLNARLYDQTLGSFLGCDNFVQNPSNSQSFNRFSYCMNNPLMYRDANGNFAFIPLLIGMAYGAAIGSATAEVTYSITAAITGNWSWKGFGKAIGMGAVGGALGGGLGYLGTTGLGAFGNSFGYSMLSNITGNSVTSAIFGSKITLGSFVGMVAGSAIGGLIGNNFGKYGESSFWNGVKDVAATTAKGLVTGYVRGFTRAAFENNSNAIWQESLGGAIGGFSSGLAINLLYGAPVNVKINFRVLNNEKLSELFKNPYQRPVFRSGGLLSLSGSLGGQVAGRDVYLNSPNANDATVAHELFYLYQQDKYGFAGFYIPTVWDQINYNMFGGSYPYTNPQSYEYEADQFEQQFYYK